MVRKKASVPEPITVRPRDLAARFEVSYITILRYVREGKLPKPHPIVVGGRGVGWTERELAEFDAKRRAA